MKKVKCFSCGEIIKQNDDTTFAEFSEHEGKEVHQSCKDQDFEYASTMVRMSAEGVDKVRFVDYAAEDIDNGECPAWFSDVFVKREYKHTSGWRGYQDSTFKLEKIEDGWTTGYPDSGTSRKGNLTDILEDISKNFDKLTCEIFVLMEQTSNVFSTAMTIYCREGKKDKLLECLIDNFDLSAEDLEFMLG